MEHEITHATLFDIQKFSLHDGPGIRSVVFFKGCPMRCPWCSNPESQSPHVEIKASNKHNEDSTWCSETTLSIQGKIMPLEDIVDEVLKDKAFYEESGGGVTLSGGEVLMQHQAARQLAKKLHAHDIHVALETTGYASKEAFLSLIEDVDLLLYDLKHVDSDMHLKVIGVSNTRILDNLRLAIEFKKDILIRIPVIPGFNDSLSDAHAFAKLIQSYQLTKVHLLPFHQYGESKYERLGLPYTMHTIKALHPEDLNDYQAIFTAYGLDCTL